MEDTAHWSRARSAWRGRSRDGCSELQASKELWKPQPACLGWPRLGGLEAGEIQKHAWRPELQQRGRLMRPGLRRLGTSPTTSLPVHSASSSGSYQKMMANRFWTARPRSARVGCSGKTGCSWCLANSTRSPATISDKERERHEDPKNRRTPQQRMADALAELILEPKSGQPPV